MNQTVFYVINACQYNQIAFKHNNTIILNSDGQRVSPGIDVGLWWGQLIIKIAHGVGNLKFKSILPHPAPAGGSGA